MNNIKGIILDVDGVLVGGKKGYNWPDPNPLIIQTLKSLHANGMLISLCTGKGTFSIKSIVEAARLDNIHIGDGGAIVIDFLHNKVIDQHIIKRDTVKKTVELLLQYGIYVELYTKDGYYIQKDYVCDKTAKHKEILNKEPSIVTSLINISNQIDVVKIMPVANDELDKHRITDLISKEAKELFLQWGVHPTALPYQFGILTAQGISKKQAVKIISKYSNVPLDTLLGIGDSMIDWQFMEILGYAGAMGNGSQELKEKVFTKGERGFIGKSVDENGVLNIFKHFGVI
jgi:HAD superfamily hydrolase (TIGR01484 family)